MITSTLPNQWDRSIRPYYLTILYWFIPISMYSMWTSFSCTAYLWFNFKSKTPFRVIGRSADSSYYRPFTSLVKYGKPLYNHTMFYPSDSVGRQDADISIIFLSGNGVFFSEPRGDAWFRVVEKPSFVPSAGGPLPNLYLPSEPASPLGCAAQYQFCNPSYQGTMACGPLAPTPPSVSLASSLHSSSAPSSLYILTCKSLGQLGFIRREDTSPTITSSGLLMPPCNYIAWHKRRWVGAYGLIVMGFSQLRKTTLC